jgi:transposase
VIKAILIELVTTVKKQAEQIECLKSEIKKRKDQLAKNSRNSSRPPSTDQGQNDPEGKIKTPKSKNKPGGQIGHPGKNMKLNDDPDEIIELPDHRCDECQDNAWTLERRQVIDVKIKVTTTEYQAKIRGCSNGCDGDNHGEFPEHAQSPVQYSPRIKGIITYLNLNYALKSRF